MSKSEIRGSCGRIGTESRTGKLSCPRYPTWTIAIKVNFIDKCRIKDTYSVVIENEGILILVKIVQWSLRNSIFDLDWALDILLVRQLYFLIYRVFKCFWGHSSLLNLLSLSLFKLILLKCWRSHLTPRCLLIERHGGIEHSGISIIGV